MVANMHVSPVHIFKAEVHWALSATIYIYTCMYFPGFPSLSPSHHPLLLLACRIVELFPAVPINPHWGIISKCLTYSKAACDPFVYSLLRHQYKKTCTDIINRLLKRSSLNASGPRHENQGNSIPTVEWQETTDGTRSGGWPGNCQENMKLIYRQWRREQNWLFLLMSAWI